MTEEAVGQDGQVSEQGWDIADRKRTEEALRAAEERLRLALEAGHIGTFDWDLVTNSLNCSRWYTELWGFKPGEFEKDDAAFLERVHPEDRPSLSGEIARCIHERLPFVREFRVIWPDTSMHWLMIRGEFSYDKTGHPLQLRGVVMDVTERKLHEDSLRAARQKAEESNRIKSDFLANMSHEVRTPLNAIIGMTYLALRANPNSQQHRYLTKIGNAAESLLGITNDILDFSKIEAGKLELETIPFQLDEVLSNLNDIVTQKAEQKGIAIVFSVARGTPHYLKGDPLRLGQILINLLNNAIKFTERGGIVVKVLAEDVTKEQGILQFSVSDTGIGMAAGQVSHLFQSFTQADTSFTRKYGGTGLGLAISKRLSELMGGTLNAESELGKGSTFVLRAPFSFPESGHAHPLRTRMMDLRKAVLVIDSDEDARIELINILYKNGFVARSASSAWEAMSALASASEAGQPFDLVIMDWHLPGPEGVESSRRIKEYLNHARVPAILMIPASERDDLFRHAVPPAPEAFLMKPAQESLLLDAIARIFGVKPAGLITELRNVPRRMPDHLRGRKVLLVEDNEINRDLATELLTDMGIKVTTAVDGQEGVNRIMVEPFDLVLMDIQMPVMDGLTATTVIRADGRFKDLPIVAMTAHALNSDHERSLLAGMSAHLTKPISPSRLLETLTQWIPTPASNLSTPSTPPLDYPGADAERSPSSLPPFEIRAALARTDGKPQLLRKLMAGFHCSYRCAAEELRTLLAAGKTNEAERLAHSLKGVAATLEAKQLAKAAGAVERALHECDLTHTEALIQSLEESLIPAIAAAERLATHPRDRETIN